MSASYLFINIIDRYHFAELGGNYICLYILCIERARQRTCQHRTVHHCGSNYLSIFIIDFYCSLARVLLHGTQQVAFFIQHHGLLVIQWHNNKTIAEQS